MLSNRKVYFKKWFDAGGMFRENKEEGLKLRLAWDPKFLLKAIFDDEVEKSWNNDMLSKALAQDVALKKFEEVLYYLNKIRHSPFVLYFTKNK